MISPEEVDSNNYLRLLTDYDEKNFRSEYENAHKDLSLDAAKAAVEALFQNRYEPKYEVFEAIADGFHPYNDEGMETGYEFELTNPLCEISETPADVLLTSHDYREVHLCFIICEPAGENYIEWATRINTVSDLYTGHEEYLLDQIPVDGLEPGHVQFVTATHKDDLPDIDFQYLMNSVSPENYSIWVVDDDYNGNEDRNVELRKEYGRISHRPLRSELEKGFDYEKGENTEVGCTLNSNELIILRESFMGLMLRQHASGRDEPREFDREDFIEELANQTQYDEPPEEKQEVIQERANLVLEVADESDMVYSKPRSEINTNRDYRLRYPSGMPTQIPEHIKPKYIDYRAPIKMAKDAFQQAKEEHEPRDQLMTEIDDSSSWGPE
ncbi:hypothetical protein Halru_0048 [Halovivax ruber XH-70]|uniref:Uncharacterized protein n=1 Tax=Halovivax ruber (strain DSM 18193 / JCM 13892 / XH-70) TaxID=797302 RepID=L0I9R4_HALRX|nr:hypothetical protein [Halovivax ruber]AGB14702.1 hypothetical protein Halru_0048 [Halovivax ruber XH-70]